MLSCRIVGSLRCYKLHWSAAVAGIRVLLTSILRVLGIELSLHFDDHRRRGIYCSRCHSLYLPFPRVAGVSYVRESQAFHECLFHHGRQHHSFLNTIHLSLFTLGYRWLMSCLFAAHDCVWNQVCSMFDLFDMGVVRVSQQNMTLVRNLYLVDRVEPGS